jgi:hypothetical protein
MSDGKAENAKLVRLLLGILKCRPIAKGRGSIAVAINQTLGSRQNRSAENYFQPKTNAKFIFNLPAPVGAKS